MIEYMRECPPDEKEYFRCAVCFDEFHINDLEVFDCKRDQYICDGCAHDVDNDPMWNNETKRKPIREIECLKCGKVSCVCKWQPKNAVFAKIKNGRFVKRVKIGSIQKMTTMTVLIYALIAVRASGLTPVAPDWLRQKACRGVTIQMPRSKLARFAKRQPVNINVLRHLAKKGE